MSSRPSRSGTCRWRRACAAVALGVLQLGALAQSLSREEDRLNLRFEGGNLEQNAAEVTGALLDRGLLRMEPHLNEAANNPAELVEAKLGWPKGVVTDQLSLALCRRNGHICSIVKDHPRWRMQRRSRLDKTSLENLSCDDAGLPPYIICLPEVPIKAYLAGKRVVANPDLDNIALKVTRELRGCDAFDARCKLVIERLNPGGRPELRDGIATMMLPAKSIQIHIRDTAARRREIENVFNTVVESIRERNGLSGMSSDMRATVPIRLKQQSAPPSARPPAAARASTPNPLQIMNYARGPVRVMPNKPVGVGVWDGYADRTHCVFKRGGRSAIVLYTPLPIDVSQMGRIPVSPGCGSFRNFLSDAFDHATFVSSLIAGKSTPPVVVGAAPDAVIWQVEHVGDNLNKDLFVTEADKLGMPDVRVVNISQTYEASADGIKTQLAHIVSPLEGYGHRVVFVAAAGNDRKDFNKPGVPCRVIPACWSNESEGANGVISVVALDASGRKLLDSSNSGLQFDVAAVGDTTGAVFGNGYARYAGTSFAAPYVSALAALLFERVERDTARIDARRIKHRILFTSTFIDGLERRMRFGRIDFARALDFSQDVLRLRPGACPRSNCTLHGDASPSTSVTISYALDEQGNTVTDLSLIMRDIKRLQATRLPTGEQRFWVVVRKNKVLKRYSAAKFSNTYLSFTGVPKVDVADVEDYTACSFNKGCDGDLLP